MKTAVRLIGGTLFWIGLIVLGGFYILGFLLGGPMVFAGGIFWEPLLIVGVGWLLRRLGQETV